MASLVADYGSQSDSDVETEDNFDSQNQESDTKTKSASLKNVSTNDQQSLTFFENSSRDNSDEEETPTKITNVKGRKPLLTLPSARAVLPSENLVAGEACTSSVFFNPFKQAEDAKTLVLEKHVKLAPKLEDVREINGKKICWNFRKGRCRFGSYCKYAHDSDLLKEPPGYKKPAPSYDESAVISTLSDKSTNDRPKTKRPGLSQTLVPGRKVLKLYRDQQRTESPWLLNH